MSDEQPQLTDKQYLFARHYVICLNATEAAARAGYQGTRPVLAVTGHDNLRNPKIRAVIDELMAEITLPKAEILGRLSAHARSDIGDLFTPSGRGVRLDMKRARELGLTPLIKKYSRSEQGTVTVEFYDAQAALQLLGKYYKLWTDVHDINGELAVKGYTTKDASPDAWDTPTDG